MIRSTEREAEMLTYREADGRKSEKHTKKNLKTYRQAERQI